MRMRVFHLHNKKEKGMSPLYVLSEINIETRSTQREHKALAEADHYSHIAHCKNVEPWL